MTQLKARDKKYVLKTKLDATHAYAGQWSLRPGNPIGWATVTASTSLSKREFPGPTGDETGSRTEVHPELKDWTSHWLTTKQLGFFNAAC